MHEGSAFKVYRVQGMFIFYRVLQSGFIRLWALGLRVFYTTYNKDRGMFLNLHRGDSPKTFAAKPQSFSTQPQTEILTGLGFSLSY